MKLTHSIDQTILLDTDPIAEHRLSATLEFTGIGDDLSEAIVALCDAFRESRKEMRDRILKAADGLLSKLLPDEREEFIIDLNSDLGVGVSVAEASTFETKILDLEKRYKDQEKIQADLRLRLRQAEEDLNKAEAKEKIIEELSGKIGELNNKVNLQKAEIDGLNKLLSQANSEVSRLRYQGR